MTRRLIVLTVLSALLVPAAADAATVRVGDGFVVYTASRGEANRLVISRDRDVGITVADAGAPVRAGSGCESLGRHRALCSAERRPASVTARLRDGNDRLRVAVEGFAGVRALGGSGADLLRGGAISDTLHGGSGRDRMFARGGGDTLIDGDRSGRAVRDVLDGGRGDYDEVTYRNRRRGVRVNLRARQAGERGERDVVRGVEHATGGRGPDRLVGTGRANDLIGLHGNDLLIGGDGGDRLKGGPGRDRLEGGDGFDDLRPGRGRDSLSCGLGYDEILNPVAGERMSNRCEEAEFWGSYGDPPFRYAKLTLPPTPVEVEPDAATFDIPCPQFPQPFRPCAGTVAIREAGGRERLLGSGRFETRDDIRDSRLVRVELTPLGRRLAGRRLGVIATVSVRGRQFRDPTSWTFRLRGP